MKVACFAYLHGLGGAERQIIMLANSLVNRNHEVSLIILADNNLKYDISEKVKIIDLSRFDNQKSNKIINRRRMIKKTLTCIKPDITVHFWLQSAYLCATMPKSLTGKLIYCERGDPGNSEYRGLLKLIRKIAFKKMDGFVFQSNGAKKFFNESIRKKSIVIHNSVSVPTNLYLEPAKNRTKRIVSVGRLHNQKNQLLLIKAFNKIKNDIPEYILEIYGEGPLEKSLQKTIDDYQLNNRVILKGTYKNIFEKIYDATLFVLSSDYEGMPNALMEAMAIGLPCISTDCRPGGARDLIENDVNGWIVPIDNVNELAYKINNVLHDENKLYKVSCNAMNIRNSHSAQNVFDKWENYFESVCKMGVNNE